MFLVSLKARPTVPRRAAATADGNVEAKHLALAVADGDEADVVQEAVAVVVRRDDDDDFELSREVALLEHRLVLEVNGAVRSVLERVALDVDLALGLVRLVHLVRFAAVNPDLVIGVAEPFGQKVRRDFLGGLVALYKRPLVRGQLRVARVHLAGPETAIFAC
jgi:hypothetical protein